ncbi:Aspartokinase / Homoserine dehydrogenase [Citrobacter freundii]|uniref:Aspartokinase / Homoserine dehydrogenase n=1 Tax=Citrobacter freundii TaxID=546 RepID=A0A7G2IN26_CITFR|nr:Aspartokinase / Homoserine dehydrogenase [Citrobacter freundii]
MGVHPDRQLLQFCYTSEVADSALKILDEAGLPGELRLRQGLALVAMVGAGAPVIRCTATVSGNS